MARYFSPVTRHCFWCRRVDMGLPIHWGALIHFANGVCSGRLLGMLFVVVEHFKGGSLEAVRERFRLKGRMLPDGVKYHASWITPDGARCYQVMESPSLDLLQEWMSMWDGLVEFEVEPVLTSSDFWADYETSHRP